MTNTLVFFESSSTAFNLEMTYYIQRTQEHNFLIQCITGESVPVMSNTHILTDASFKHTALLRGFTEP